MQAKSRPLAVPRPRDPIMAVVPQIRVFSVAATVPLGIKGYRAERSRGAADSQSPNRAVAIRARVATARGAWIHLSLHGLRILGRIMERAC